MRGGDVFHQGIEDRRSEDGRPMTRPVADTLWRRRTACQSGLFPFSHWLMALTDGRAPSCGGRSQGQREGGREPPGAGQWLGHSAGRHRPGLRAAR